MDTTDPIIIASAGSRLLDDDYDQTPTLFTSLKVHNPLIVFHGKCLECPSPLPRPSYLSDPSLRVVTTKSNLRHARFNFCELILQFVKKTFVFICFRKLMLIFVANNTFSMNFSYYLQFEIEKRTNHVMTPVNDFLLNIPMLLRFSSLLFVIVFRPTCTCVNKQNND